jgi:rhodanese-related sulfurtransferase
MIQNKHIFPGAVNAQQANDLLQSDRAMKIIDVRTPAEFETVHIPGSYNMPLDQLPEHQHELGRTVQDPIILVCRSGQRAEQALRLLQQTNLPQLHVLVGGITAWEQQGFPVKRGKQRWSMERQVRGLAGSIVLLGTLGGLFVWKPLLYLAAAIGAGLTYSALTDTCGMAILLSKLPYNRSATCDIRDVIRQLASDGERNEA